MALRLAVYLRKSSKDSEDKQVHSIERQRNDTFDYIERNNKVEADKSRILVIDEDKDVYFEDESAKRPGRKVFNKMVELIKKNKYEVLLCTDLSRLSRNAIDGGVLVQLLEDGHLKEIRTMDKVFTSNNTDKFTLGLFLLVAKFENDQKGTNTKSGMDNRKKGGHTTNRAPIGYINMGEQKGMKWVEEDGENFERCKSLWTMYLSGNVSIKALYLEAKRIGVTAIGSKGQRRTPVETTIRGMLSNKYYTGKIKLVDENGIESWGEGQHPPMVTMEEFDSVQLILQKNGFVHAKLNSAPDMVQLIKAIAISGLYKVKDKDGDLRPAAMLYEHKRRVTCSKCKHRFTSKNDKPCPECSNSDYGSNKITVNEILSHHAEGKKKSNSIQLKTVISFLEEALSKLYISDDLFKVLRKQLYTLWLEQNKVISSKRKELTSKLNKLEDDRGSLYSKKLLDEAKPVDLNIAIESVEKKLADLGDQLDELRDSYEEKFEKSWQALQVLRDAKEILGPTKEFEPKKRLLLSLISNLVFYRDKMEVVWQKPFDQLVKTDIAKNSGGAGPTNCFGKNLNGSVFWKPSAHVLPEERRGIFLITLWLSI